MDQANQMMQYDANKKSVLVAYILWFFVGSFGAHRFYLGKSGTGATILAITLASILLMFVFIGFFTIWVSAIWVFVDIFLIPSMAQSYNMVLANSMASSG